MSLKVDKVQLEIIMKSDTARAEIIKLEDKAKSLQKEMKRLSKNPEELAKASAEYDKVKNRMTELRKEIGLTGMTMRELQQRQKELNMQMRHMDPRTEKFAEYKKELTQVNARMRELRVTGQQAQSALSEFTNKFNKYFYAAVPFIATFTSIGVAIKKLVDGYAELEDSYADVMKVTGLTREETEKLNSEYSKLDTRTSRESLNQLAVQAGKLGIEGTKNILSFVDAGNQINVALGEDLGADAVQNIGKMVGVFDEVTTQLQGKDLKGQLLAVGSAVNSLGQASSASEQYLVNFSGRLGGVASQAKISLADVLGFASQLDQDMQHVEMSATSFQMFITKMMAEPAKFAKIAGLNVKEFTNLVSTDANAAIKKILTTLNEKGGFQQLIPIFEGMNLDGSRAIGVLSSMASSIDKINEAQLLANQSMADGTSIINEYNVKNNNVAAQLEKNKKQLNDVSNQLGQKLTPVITNSLSLFTSFLSVLIKYPAITYTLIAAVSTLGLTYAALYAVKIKNNIVDKANLIIDKAKLISTQLQSLAQAVLTGNIVATRVAWEALNTAMKANVILAITGAVVGLGMAIYKIATRTTEAEKATESFYEDLAKEQSTLQSLVTEYNYVNTSKERKLQLIQQLESQYGVYLDDLKDEEGLITDIAVAQFRANKQLQDNLALKGKQQFVENAQEDYFKEQLKNVDKFKSAMEDAGLTDFQVGEFASRINTMFRDSGADVNKTMRIAANFMESQGVTVNSAMRKSMQAMAKSANEMNVAKREAEETFNVFLSNGDNILDDLVVTPGKKKGGGGGTTAPGDKTTKGIKTDPADIALKAAEESYKVELLALKNSLIEKEITETQFAEKGEKLHFDYLASKLKIQQDFGKSTVDVETEIADWKLNKQKTFDQHLLDDIKLSNESKLISLSEFDTLQKQQLQDMVDDGTITNAEYQSRLQAIELTSAQARLQIARDYLALVEQGEFNSVEAKQKAVDAAAKAVEQASKEEEKAVKASNRAKLKSEEDYQNERKNLLDKLGLRSIRQQYEYELKELKDHLDKKLLTEKEYEQAKEKLKGEKLNAYADSAIQFAQYVSDAVSSYHKMEADSLEAEKQRELTAAGNNADAREAIEKKYAQKELDLKKKQANADMAINIGTTIANGAGAAIKAYFDLGPIAGPIAAGIIAAMTLFQIASIKKQRDAIMATTLDTSSSSSSAIPSASRTPNSQLPVTPQAAEGRWDVVGADDRRTYRNVPYRGIARTGIVSRPTLMGERGDELIIDNPTLRNIRLNAPYLLDDVRRLRVGQRAYGKWDTAGVQSEKGSPGLTSQLILDENVKIMQEVSSLLRWLKENRIEAYTVLSEFEKKRDLRDKSLRKGSL